MSYFFIFNSFYLPKRNYDFNGNLMVYSFRSKSLQIIIGAAVVSLNRSHVYSHWTIYLNWECNRYRVIIAFREPVTAPQVLFRRLFHHSIRTNYLKKTLTLAVSTRHWSNFFVNRREEVRPVSWFNKKITV